MRSYAYLFIYVYDRGYLTKFFVAQVIKRPSIMTTNEYWIRKNGGRKQSWRDLKYLEDCGSIHNLISLVAEPVFKAGIKVSFDGVLQ
jgi:hypothetical protein